MVDNRWIDPELDDMFKDDPELAALAGRLRAARPEPAIDPRFPNVLRAQLMREAETALAGSRARGRFAGARAASAAAAAAAAASHLTRRPSWWRRPAPLAWGGASVGVALVAAAGLLLFNTHVQDQKVTAKSAVAELHAVSPDNVITVAFSEAMNQTAVVAGLHIRPATQVSTSWQGNNLLISPTHRLAGNTPYTVTIDRGAAKAASGAVAAADIRISFGTAPTPPPAPTVATLTTTALGPVTGDAVLGAGPSGGVIATSSSAAPSPSPSAATSPSASPSPSSGSSESAAPSPSPSPSESSQPSATPSARQSPSPSASPSPSERVALPAGGNRLVLFGTSGSVDLGPAATSAALSGDGRHLISSVPSGSSSQIVLTTIGSAKSTVLTSIGVPVLATGWLSADTALVAEADRITSVDLQGHVSTLATLPSGTTRVIIAPTGTRAFAGNSGGDGTLIDLSRGTGRVLTGSRTVVAFSGDGSTVAWVDGAGGSQLVISPVDREASATIPLDHPGDVIADLALDRTGARAAIVDQPTSGDSHLEIKALPSGTVIARGPGGAHLVFINGGNRIAFVSGNGEVQVATLPGDTSVAAVNVLPDGAAGVLQAFTQAQMAGDGSALSALAMPSVDAAGVTPHGITRAYVISAAVNADGTVAATGRLIVDASASHPLVSFADETLTLAPSSGKTAYQVSAIKVAPLRDEPVGPHVVHVTPTAGSGKLVLQVAFDSDLRPETVAAAISVATKGGRALHAQTTYDVDRRTAVVTVDVSADTPVSLTVGSGLLDVDGQAMDAVFTTLVGG